MDILYLLKKIEDSPKSIRLSDVDRLKVSLISHSNFEDEVVYPKLEKDLADEERALMIDRINEILE